MWLLPGIKVNFLSGVDPLQKAYASHYEPWMVAVSVLIAVFAGISAFVIVNNTAGSKQRGLWLALAACMLGAGVWAMHFIGMLAFRIDCGVGYAPWITALSILPGILAAAIALNVIAQEGASWARILFGCAIMGAGIGLMH